MPNIEKVRELQSKVMKDIAAGAIIPIMMIGDELGLFEKLYEFGPYSSENFARKIFVGKLLTRSTIFTCFCTAQTSIFQNFFVIFSFFGKKCSNCFKNHCH